MKIVVTKQVAEETAIVFDVGIDGCGEVVMVDGVKVGLVVLPISWVVDHESIGWRGTANNKSVYGVRLVF
jgi:hypothetical protein